MNDEHFEEINEIVFPTPEHAASVLGVDEQFPTVLQSVHHSCECGSLT
ncbi:GntR family transcriptional regulator [Streptococcus pneumoniae]|nr:GntR family transcriptional regulator [Streptococcus pneumoniae]